MRDAYTNSYSYSYSYFNATSYSHTPWQSDTQGAPTTTPAPVRRMCLPSQICRGQRHAATAEVLETRRPRRARVDGDH